MSGIIASLIEKRYHVSQTPPGWVEKYFGVRTTAGVQVDESNAMQFIAVYACIRILAETMASLPLITYKRLEGGGKERATDFYLYPILHDMANPEMTAYQFRETLMGHITSWGNGYAQIIFNQAGRVTELWPLRPDRMMVKRVNGQLQYYYRLNEADSNGNFERIFQAYEIFHVPGLGFDGIVGYSPITMARQAIGLGLAAEEFGARFFSNDARPGFVLQHPAQLSEPAYDRLKKSVDDEHGGLEKSHKPMILEEGMTVKEIGIPPEDAQYLETRKFQINEIARLYRMPPHMLADLERATWSNIEQQSLDFVIYTLRAWLVRWEQAISKYLLTPAERKAYFAEHLVDGLLRGDLKTRYEAYHLARLDGWLNVDEIREFENMNPLPENQGKVYLIPLNMVPAGSARAKTAIFQAASAMRGLYKDTIERILRREKNDVLGAAKKYLDKGDHEQFNGWLVEFYSKHSEFIFRQMQPLIESHAEALMPGESGNKELIKRYLDDFAQTHTEKSRSGVENLIKRSQGEPDFDVFGGLESLFDEWIGERASEISDLESMKFGAILLKETEGR